MKRSVIILSISVFANEVNGFRGAIITAPTPENETGVWKKTTKQLDRFANQVGAPDLNALARHAKGGQFTYEYEAVKAGQEWVNEKTQETGTYSKDHIRVNNEEVALNPMEAMALTASSQIASNFMKHMLGSSSSAPATAVSTDTPGSNELDLVTGDEESAKN